MADRAAVVAEAMSWLGTPYHHHARIKGVGVDCAQILMEVYCGLGVVPGVTFVDYAHDWHLHRSEELYAGWLDKYGSEIEREEVKPGDVALFKYGRCFSHGGIVVEGGLIVHAYVGRGVCLNRMDEEPLEGRPVRFWKVMP